MIAIRRGLNWLSTNVLFLIYINYSIAMLFKLEIRIIRIIA